MRTLHTICLSVASVAMLLGCKHGAPRYACPQEPVISVEQRSRMFRVISPQSKKEVVPGVHIFVDGRCTVRTFKGEELERRLKPSDVRVLLDFFDRQGLFAISDASIERAIVRELQQPVPYQLPDGSIVMTTRHRGVTIDASYSRIAVRTANKKADIRRYALQSELEEYRTVTELRSVQRCIEKVYEVAGEID